MSDSSVPSSPNEVTSVEMEIPDETSPSSSRSESPVVVSKRTKSESSGSSAIRYFESTYYDEYDYYNLEPDNKFFTHASGKGRSKREASQHSSRWPSHWGVLAKLENESNNRKRNNLKAGRHRSISK